MSSLYMHEMEGDFAKEMDLLLFPLQEKIRLMEAELAANCTEAAAFDSPSIMVEEFKLLEINNNEHSSEALKAAKLSTVLRSQGTPSMFSQEVVGYKDEAEQLICQLTRGSKQLDIVSIVGMPGQGKTTLANKVYHDALITCHFHTRAWCCISQVYQKQAVLLEILACIEPESNLSKLDEDYLAHYLYRRLKRNRYLLVLDDIWDIRAWNCLERSFPDDANGSRILLTSRIHNLALEVKPTTKPLPLRQLTDDESWELLQKKLAERNGHPPVKSVLGLHLAKGCKGLPLTIVIIAGVLATLDEDGWEEVAEMLSSKVVCGTEQCMDILELSYIHLPKHLKPCLLYFGAFLENQEIPIWRLMRMWIAEGFVHKTEPKSLEDTAEDYIMDLIGRSLVIVSKQKSTGTVKACRIHNLLHEFCVTKAKEQKFLKLRHCYAEILNFDEPSNTHRLFVYTKGKNFEKSRLFCPLLRTLLVSAQFQEYKIQSNFHFVVRIFKRLRVLDFAKINLGSIFPGEIALLVQLTFLAVGGTMEYIPSSIANLSKLETFLLESRHHILSLPDSIWNMQTLRYLHASGSFFNLSLAEDNDDSSSDLYNLHTFSALNLILGQNVNKIIAKFPNICKLKCRFKETKESVGEWSKIVVMDFLTRLESLNLSFGIVGENPYEFHLPSNLKKLTLKEFPWSIISTTRKLPNLQVLKLVGAERGGTEIWNMEEGEFPKLKFLKLVSLRIVRWTGSGDHLPCLQKLVVEGCGKLEQLPSCLGDTLTLEKIEVRRCRPFVRSLVCEIEEEQMSWGNDNLKIHILEEIEDSSSSDSDNGRYVLL
ncbi:putative late blight resistance protein homolog R1B-14 [Coffea eugenioides]|uniref:putative late blight resistance protein homolog R1B-14 n=1 Tax=Coffea eugenioides TaxID=49369 RepID=UPI000F611918|nr:putative late blight resistance protein homolog R1B-14 [Coffea eugenioides]